MAWIYNPDDEDDLQTVSGHVFHLPANEAVEILPPPDLRITSELAAELIVEKLGMWGVCQVSGPVKNSKASNPEDQALVDAAERKYLEATKTWAEGAIVEDVKRRKPFIDAGLTGPAESDDAKKGRAWLGAYAKRLREAKLIN